MKFPKEIPRTVWCKIQMNSFIRYYIESAWTKKTWPAVLKNKIRAALKPTLLPTQTMDIGDCLCVYLLCVFVRSITQNE